VSTPEGYEEISLILQHGRDGYFGCADTSLFASHQDSNYGGDDILHRNYPVQNAILLRFDLSSIPKGALVRRAALSLYNLSVGWGKPEMYQPGEVVFRLCQEAWAEGSERGPAPDPADGATYRTRDGQTPWLSPGGDAGSNIVSIGVTQGRAGHFYKWGLPPRVVQDWITGRMPNRGLTLRSVPGWPAKGVALASREHPDVAKRPRLALVLDLPKEDARELREKLIQLRRVAPQRQREEADEREMRVRRAQRRKWEKTLGKPLACLGARGEDVVIDGVRWKILQARDLGQVLKARHEFFEDRKTSGRFVFLEIEVENLTKEPLTFLERTLLDKQGRSYNALGPLGPYFDANTVFVLENINPNVPLRFVQVSEVAKNASGFVIEISNLRLIGRKEGLISLGF
jgi:hypothetical protein